MLHWVDCPVPVEIRNKRCDGAVFLLVTDSFVGRRPAAGGRPSRLSSSRAAPATLMVPKKNLAGPRGAGVGAGIIATIHARAGTVGRKPCSQGRVDGRIVVPRRAFRWWLGIGAPTYRTPFLAKELGVSTLRASAALKPVEIFAFDFPQPAGSATACRERQRFQQQLMAFYRLRCRHARAVAKPCVMPPADCRAPAMSYAAAASPLEENRRAGRLGWRGVLQRAPCSMADWKLFCDHTAGRRFTLLHFAALRPQAFSLIFIVRALEAQARAPCLVPAI